MLPVNHSSAHRLVASALAAAAGLVLASASLQAGECPADKRGVNVREPGPMMPKGVTDTVLAMTDLAKEKVGLKDHQLRIRRLVIEPGGVVPWHSHADRPAMIYIVQGTVVEYASTCSGPIEHKAGEVAREINGTDHWWKNLSGETVVLISADILHDRADHNM